MRGLLEEVSFPVRNGTKITIMGQNGAGKSTSFNILTAFIPKTSGSVKLKGEEVYK